MDHDENVRIVRETFFPTFVYYADLAGAKELNAEIKPLIYAWRARDPDGITRSNARRFGSWHSPSNMNELEAFAGLTRRLLAVAQKVFVDLGYPPERGPVFDNMWANINPRHGYNRPHVHPRSLWSGVYYVQVPPDGGSLSFDDPRPGAGMVPPVYSDEGAERPASWAVVHYEAIEGRVLLFPAWLSHQVDPNATREEGPAADRISVSFNFVQGS